MIRTILKKEEAGFTWIDVVEPTRQELSEIADAYQLHPTSVEDCMDPEHLPKFEKFPDINFFIVRAFDETCHSDAETVQEMTRKVAVFFTDQMVLTVHRSEQRYLTQMMDSRRKYTEARTTDQKLFLLLIDIIRGALGTLEKGLDIAEQNADRMESRIVGAKNISLLTQQLYSQKRRISIFKRMLRLTMDFLFEFDASNPRILPLIRNLREEANSLYIYADDLQEYMNDLINTNISLLSHRTNEVVRILTLFSVFFMPLTFIVGIYGMNFEHMPELRMEYGYPGVLLFMAFISFLIFIWFRRKGWLR